MNKKWVWVGLGAVFLGLVSYFIYHQWCMGCLAYFKPAHVRDFISGFGPWAFVVYVLLYIINTITLLPPIAILSLSAGILFGPVWGGVAILVGALSGTTVTFFIARFFGKKWVTKFIKGEKAEAFQKKLSDHGFVVILPMRLIGFPPYEVVNYASGLSTITYRDYILSTAIGFLPASFAQSFLSDRVIDFNLNDPTLYFAIVAFLLVIFVPTLLLKNKRTKTLVGKEDYDE